MSPTVVPFAPSAPMPGSRIWAKSHRAIRRSDRAASRAAKAKRLLSATRPKHRTSEEF